MSKVYEALQDKDIEEAEYTQTLLYYYPTAKEPVTSTEDVCIHCGGTGIFVSCAGTVDEIEKKCVCQIDEE